MPPQKDEGQDDNYGQDDPPHDQPEPNAVPARRRPELVRRMHPVCNGRKALQRGRGSVRNQFVLP